MLNGKNTTPEYEPSEPWWLKIHGIVFYSKTSLPHHDVQVSTFRLMIIHHQKLTQSLLS